MAQILLIDDNTDLLELERVLLSSAGHDVAVARDGKEGLTLVESQRFDLVVTDLFMPEMDGMEVILALRRSKSSPKIIAVSGNQCLNPVHQLLIARKLGAVATLLKPFAGRELLDSVESALGGRTPCSSLPDQTIS